MRKNANLASKSLCLAVMLLLCIGLLTVTKVHAEDYEELKYTAVNSFDELFEKYETNEAVINMNWKDFTYNYIKTLHFTVKEDGWFAIRSYNYAPQVFLYSNNMFTKKVKENRTYYVIGGKDYYWNTKQTFYLTKGEYWIEFTGLVASAYNGIDCFCEGGAVGDYGDCTIKTGFFFLPTSKILNIDSITYSDNNSVANVTFKPISKNISKIFLYDNIVSSQSDFFSSISSHNIFAKYIYYGTDDERREIEDCVANGFEISKDNGTYTLCIEFKDDEYKAYPVAVSFTIDQIGVEASKIEVKSVKLNKTKATLKVGDTLTLKATLKPKNATDKTISWKSSNKKVATVDENGIVTAKKKGTCTITATSSSGKKAKCKITVKK